MQENHEPTCSFCAKFIKPFNPESPLGDWGYCQEEVAEDVITLEKIKEIVEQVKNGDHSFLTKGDIPLYEAIEEGCEKFEYDEHHHD